MSAGRSSSGQDSVVMHPLFNPTMELLVRGRNARDLLCQIIGCVTAAAESGHVTICVQTNSVFVCNAVNTLCHVWQLESESSGVWRDQDGNPVPFQEQLETIIKLKERLDMRVFLCEPVIHTLE